MQENKLFEIKKKVLNNLIFTLEKSIENLKKELENLNEDIINSPSRKESRYDSRRMELSYLQYGYQRKLEESYTCLSELKNLEIKKQYEVSKGALVKLSNGFIYFVAPCMAGTEVKLNDLKILVISTESPLYDKLRGKNKGDKVILPNGQEVTLEAVI